MSRWDRLLIFGAFNLAAAACFVICFTLFPVLALKPRKFAILYVHPAEPACSLSLACCTFRVTRNYARHSASKHPTISTSKGVMRLELRKHAAWQSSAQMFQQPILRFQYLLYSSCFSNTSLCGLT